MHHPNDIARIASGQAMVEILTQIVEIAENAENAEIFDPVTAYLKILTIINENKEAIENAENDFR